MVEGTDDRDLVNFPKLTTGDYLSWKLRVKGHMIDKNYWIAIEPGYVEIGVLNIDQGRLNRMALFVLYRSVGDDFLLDIEDCERAKLAWEVLEEIRVTSTKFHALQSMKEMALITKMVDMTMHEYAASIQ
ncbi:hypothetical protein PR048_022182 [Dryococelus australis]|uniref:Uncharacterized protein n=1 Tax=Dryococelus australis TaxID=614101 RepID=A0ABQ9H0C5_9NEOP|nr:hypothetical protein PR048_022182 [Dryococelus australis]